MCNRILHAAIAFLLWVPLFVRAKPYNPQQVPQTAQWIIHFDFDALKETDIAREITRIKDANAVVSFVIRRMDSIHSILLFGNGFSSDKAVLMVNGQFNAGDKVEIELKEENASGIYYSRDLLILGHDKNENASAVLVLDQKAPSLGKESPLAAPGLKNAIFLCSAIKPKNVAVLQKEPWMSLLDNMSDGSLSISMNKDEIQAQTLLTASSDDVASNVEIAFKGIQAILRLRGADSDKPAIKTVVRLFANAQIDSLHKKITIQMKIPIKDLMNIVSQAVPEMRNPPSQPSK